MSLEMATRWLQKYDLLKIYDLPKSLENRNPKDKKYYNFFIKQDKGYNISEGSE